MQDLMLFKKYKNEFLSICFILGGITIVFLVILPNFQAISAQASKNADEQRKLANINFSNQFIQSANEAELQDNLRTASDALPNSKNITAIYRALTSAAADSGVAFDGFTVSPGGIYGDADDVEQGTPSVIVTAKISNFDTETLSSFLLSLSDTPPLSEVTEISLGSGTADIKILFFYKPYNLNQIESDIVTPLTETEKDLLIRLEPV